MNHHIKSAREQKKRFIFQDGKLYFTRSTEKNLYFFLTVFMAVLGILCCMGVL